MNKTDYIKMVVERNKNYFNTGITLSRKFRIKQLENLKNSIKINEKYIYAALKKDLNKSFYESYLTEISMVYEEIDFAIKNLKNWMKPEKVKTSISQMPAKVKIYKEPYGLCLIMAPWNYPFQLAMSPLVGAIAAGNCAVVKPSNYSENVSRAILLVIHSSLPRELVTVILGGREENQCLLENKFDYIFFTGSPDMGKVVMNKASKYLTPVTLELGGKSPAIVTKSADIKKSVKRIIFGKVLNAGQTCVAPDYVLVDEYIREEFLFEMKKQLEKLFKNHRYYRKKYPKMINQKHFARIISYLEDVEIIYGGGFNEKTLQIEPTLVLNPSDNSGLMKEEIFGPILPIKTYFNLDLEIDKLKKSDKPLALYLFTRNKSDKKKVIKNISFGGGCVNDTILHVATTQAGFGGVGNSGMGRYHGKDSFNTFSNEKLIVDKSLCLDNNLRYHPYNCLKFGIIKMILN